MPKTLPSFVLSKILQYSDTDDCIRFRLVSRKFYELINFILHLKVNLVDESKWRREKNLLGFVKTLIISKLSDSCRHKKHISFANIEHIDIEIQNRQDFSNLKIMKGLVETTKPQSISINILCYSNSVAEFSPALAPLITRLNLGFYFPSNLLLKYLNNMELPNLLNLRIGLTEFTNLINAALEERFPKLTSFKIAYKREADKRGEITLAPKIPTLRALKIFFSPVKSINSTVGLEQLPNLRELAIVPLAAHKILSISEIKKTWPNIQTLQADFSSMQTPHIFVSFPRVMELDSIGKTIHPEFWSNLKLLPILTKLSIPETVLTADSQALNDSFLQFKFLRIRGKVDYKHISWINSHFPNLNTLQFDGELDIDITCPLPSIRFRYLTQLILKEDVQFEILNHLTSSSPLLSKISFSQEIPLKDKKFYFPDITIGHTAEDILDSQPFGDHKYSFSDD